MQVIYHGGEIIDSTAVAIAKAVHTPGTITFCCRFWPCSALLVHSFSITLCMTIRDEDSGR